MSRIPTSYDLEDGEIPQEIPQEEKKMDLNHGMTVDQVLWFSIFYEQCTEKNFDNTTAIVRIFNYLKTLNPYGKIVILKECEMHFTIIYDIYEQPNGFIVCIINSESLKQLKFIVNDNTVTVDTKYRH